MTDGGIPESVRQFLLTHVDSIEQLEVLLLLRASPAREWSAEGINQELGSSVASIRDRLATLASKGVLVTREQDGHLLYQYEPADEVIRGLIDDLATAYRKRRLTVIDLIYSDAPKVSLFEKDG